MEDKNQRGEIKIIPITQLKTKKIKVNGKEIETSKSGKFLVLNITVNGFVGHITKTIKKGNGILSQLRRFSNLTPKIKTILIKTLLIPVMEYPSIPICMASPSQKRKMQTVINKALRFIHCNEHEQLNVYDLRKKYNITPLNISNHYKALNVLKTIRTSEFEQYEALVTPHNNKHPWSPKSSIIIRMESPQPIIT